MSFDSKNTPALSTLFIHKGSFPVNVEQHIGKLEHSDKEKFFYL